MQFLNFNFGETTSIIYLASIFGASPRIDIISYLDASSSGWADCVVNSGNLVARGLGLLGLITNYATSQSGQLTGTRQF